MKKGNDRYVRSARGKTFTPFAARTIIFQRENLNFLMVCFTQRTLFFSIRLISIAGLFAVRYFRDVCNEDNCCVVTHPAADSLVASLSLLTRRVYIRTYCVPIATLNQNKRSPLLYFWNSEMAYRIRTVNGQH